MLTKINHKKLLVLMIPLGAILMATATYILVGTVSQPNSWLRELFFERSWIQHLNTFLFWLCMALLALKHWAHRHEMDAFRAAHEIVTNESISSLTWQDTIVLSEPLKSEDNDKFRESVVFRRILTALDRLENTKSTAELREHMRTYSDIDVAVLDSSYAHVKYIVWLIPTLGFIGTVLGIGKAISQCGALVVIASQSHAMPDIEPALAALGTAFDTTFLALVFSAIGVFYLSCLAKEEEQLLERIDYLCIAEVCGSFQEHSTVNDELLRRMTKIEEGLVENIHGDRAEIIRALVKRLPPALAQALAAQSKSNQDELTRFIQAVAEDMKQSVSVSTDTSMKLDAGTLQELRKIAKEHTTLLEALVRVAERPDTTTDSPVESANQKVLGD
jgi:biopolymer transport protein ExbB/TolQ